MTLPREIVAGRFYMLTRRCTQRQFLLRPDAETNNAFIYCLAEAAERFRIDIILSQQMSNHHHTILLDREGNVIAFAEHFHKMLAKCQNALRGRWENLWSSEPPCLVHLVEQEDVLDKLVYAATNPVKDRLVERVHHWPGVNAVGALLEQRPLRATRPRHYFAKTGRMPTSVTLTLAVPVELGAAAVVLADLRARVAAVEAAEAALRAERGERILGRRCVLRQSWRDTPTSHEPRRGLRPRVAARCKWARLEALRRNREFVIAYREARRAWIAGSPAVFPIGTYWLHRFVNVPVAAA